jgi:hypothetical protein
VAWLRSDHPSCFDPWDIVIGALGENVAAARLADPEEWKAIDAIAS